MKPLLPSYVSFYQTAFILGRQIQDNLIITHECFHYLKLKKKGNKKEIAVKVDMKKAYHKIK